MRARGGAHEAFLFDSSAAASSGTTNATAGLHKNAFRKRSLGLETWNRERETGSVYGKPIRSAIIVPAKRTRGVVWR
jgi:hypothetical protein